MKTKIVNKKMDVPIIEGCDPVFIATLCIDESGRAGIAYNVLEGINMVKLGQALEDIGRDIAGKASQA